MKHLARSRPFLVLAALLLAVFVIGQFWKTPFHDDAVGLPRAFREVWQVVTIPVRLVLGLVWMAGGSPSPAVAWLALAGWLALFLGADRLFNRIAQRGQV